MSMLEIPLEDLPPFISLKDDAEILTTQSGDRRKVWRVMSISSIFSVVLVVTIWVTWYCMEGPQSTHTFSSPFGWLAAGAGALVFSFTEVPVKVPGSQDVGAVLFNAYGYVGCAFINIWALLALAIMGLPFKFQLHGFFAAVDIMVVQYFARQAVWLLGIGAAPACWGTVGILTSFLWGTVAFGDTPWDLPIAIVGLCLLIAGVVLVSVSLFMSRKSTQSNAEGTHQTARTDILIGLGVAVLAGVCDGSLVTFFVHFEKGSESGRTLEGMLQYLSSFGLALIALNAIIVLIHVTLGPGRKLKWRDFRILQCGVPGALSGMAWALANSCGILSAHYMGMAIAFPLTQTAIIFGGLWGLFIFKEVKTRLAASVFLFAMFMATSGAILLALFGRSTKPWP